VLFDYIFIWINLDKNCMYKWTMILIRFITLLFSWFVLFDYVFVLLYLNKLGQKLYVHMNYDFNSIYYLVIFVDYVFVLFDYVFVLLYVYKWFYFNLLPCFLIKHLCCLIMYKLCIYFNSNFKHC
jgi:hypothetical protein